MTEISQTLKQILKHEYKINVEFKKKDHDWIYVYITIPQKPKLVKDYIRNQKYEQKATSLNKTSWFTWEGN